MVHSGTESIEEYSMSNESHKESQAFRFGRGFFSVMSLPMANIFGIGARRPRRTAKPEKHGIGRHFAKVGGMISDAYDREMASAGIRK